MTYLTVAYMGLEDLHMTQQPASPVTPPIPQPESDFYWEKCKEHELWLRHCNACDQAYFYPRDICPGCYSRDTNWIQSSGKGELYAFAVVHRAPVASFRDRVPYVTAMVVLEEGARMPANLVEVEPDPAVIKIGMPVEVTFERRTEEISVPLFRPRA